MLPRHRTASLPFETPFATPALPHFRTSVALTFAALISVAIAEPYPSSARVTTPRTPGRHEARSTHLGVLDRGLPPLAQLLLGDGVLAEIKLGPDEEDGGARRCVVSESVRVRRSD
jgi:hypothetical protein